MQAAKIVEALLNDQEPDDDPGLKDSVLRRYDLDRIAGENGYKPLGDGQFYKDVSFDGFPVTITITNELAERPGMEGTVDVGFWDNWHMKHGSRGWFGSGSFQLIQLPEILPELESQMAATRFDSKAWRSGLRMDHKIKEIVSGIKAALGGVYHVQGDLL